MRFLALLPALFLGISPVFAQAPMPTLTDVQRTDLRCSAAFAIVAMEQAGGDALPGWPPLALRGKSFFADTGERVMREGGLARDAVRALIAAEVQALQAAPDPDAALAALAEPCIARLDATVPPLKQPDLAQCAAILDMAYEEIHAREGMSAAARDLKTLAMVLADRQRKALTAQGATGEAVDRALTQARAAMAAQGVVDQFDIAHCYDLAKPDEKSHY